MLCASQYQIHDFCQNLQAKPTACVLGTCILPANGLPLPVVASRRQRQPGPPPGPSIGDRHLTTAPPAAPACPQPTQTDILHRPPVHNSSGVCCRLSVEVPDKRSVAAAGTACCHSLPTNLKHDAWGPDQQATPFSLRAH